MPCRRTLVVSIGAVTLVWPIPSLAQAPSRKLRRIGFLLHWSKQSPSDLMAARWIVELRNLGWTEGQNVEIERRYSDGDPERLPDLARELVNADVELIVVGPTIELYAAKQATSLVPIVAVFALDPVAEGLIASFARPGGNITGVSRMLGETAAKRLELITTFLPAAKTFGVLAGTRYSEERVTFEDRYRAVARGLHVELEFFWYQNIDDVSAAIPAMAGRRIQAFMLEPRPYTFAHRDRIAELALKHRLPGVFTLRQYASAGGLMSYGPSYSALEKQQTQYIDRILRGAKPADLPVEQPTKFELVINMKTARALGLSVPQALLLRADELIEQ